MALTTLAVMYWYENENTNEIQTCWTWDQAVLYSAVVTATDPVSVVSLLKSMTSLKTLSTVIEGESVSEFYLIKLNKNNSISYLMMQLQ